MLHYSFGARKKMTCNCTLLTYYFFLPLKVVNLQWTFFNSMAFLLWLTILNPIHDLKFTLQMFCLQNTQMFVCVLNSRTNIGCFYMYLSVMDNKYFHVVFTLNQTLNSLKNKHILSNLQKNFCCFNKLFSYWQNFLSFFAGYEIWFWF